VWLRKTSSGVEGSTRLRLWIKNLGRRHPPGIPPTDVEPHLVIGKVSMREKKKPGEGAPAGLLPPEDDGGCPNLERVPDTRRFVSAISYTLSPGRWGLPAPCYIPDIRNSGIRSIHPLVARTRSALVRRPQTPGCSGEPANLPRQGNQKSLIALRNHVRESSDWGEPFANIFCGSG
jgi:hypothetical protein